MSRPEVKEYTVVTRYLEADVGWTEGRRTFPTLIAAAQAAERFASELDREYGGSHFWTVDIYGNDLSSSYQQLFHGRLR